MVRKRKQESSESVPSKRQKASAATADGPGTSTGGGGDVMFLPKFITDPTWKNKLSHVFKEGYFQNLDLEIAKAYNDKKQQIFPPQELVFNALNTTPFNEVKVVLLGQDPYHDDNQAHGLSFSVQDGIKFPPSLRNMFKELDTDISGFVTPTSGSLLKWAERGVLLLNATLTVVAHQPNSHAKLGWQKFTDEVIRVLSNEGRGIVFLLWGGFAHKKEKLIDATNHAIVKTAHPSPLSFKKFEGCKCFSKVNKELIKLGKKPIDWKL